MSETDWSAGAAFIDDRFVPIEAARISVLDWGFTHSDVTYDVVHVWKGAFFRLEDHLERFAASMRALRLESPYGGDDIRGILIECVRRSSLRDAYVAMVATRGRPRKLGTRRPSNCENRLIAYAIPFVWVVSPEIQERGAHMIISSVERISPQSVDPTVKNYHWGDLTRALFEAEDRGADSAILLDRDGLVTEGPGFNVFAVIDGAVVSPDRGALEGITRKSILDLCDELSIPHRVQPVTADQLRGADEVFTTTTAGGVMPVSRLDDRVLGDGGPGPISARLRTRYWQKHDEGWHATPVDYG